MTIRTFTFNPFQTNCFVCSSDGTAVIVDPSSADETEHAQIIDYLADNKLVVERVLLTHAHLDHIFGLARLCRVLDVPFLMHRSDLPLLEHAEEQARLFGTDVDAPPPPGGFLDQGDRIAAGSVTWEVLHTPGHSPGSISLFNRSDGVLLSGDVLFAGSIGRTDLWQASLPTLMESIFQRLVPLGENVRVLPGHGPETTIGEERRSNPFLVGHASSG